MSLNTTIYLIKDQKITLDFVNECRPAIKFNDDFEKSLEWSTFPVEIEGHDCCEFVLWFRDEFLQEINANDAISIVLDSKVVNTLYETWSYQYFDSSIFLKDFDWEQLCILRTFRFLLELTKYGSVQFYCSW